MKQLFIKTTLALILFGLLPITSLAQQKRSKALQTLNVNKDVTINLESDYTHVIVDTWNKNSIEVEAFVESDKRTQADLQKVLEQWSVNVSGSNSDVNITSKGQQNYWEMDYEFDVNSISALQELEFELAQLPPVPPMPNIPNIPKVPEMPKMPKLPELPEGISSVNFDYEAYKKEGETYLEKWSKGYQKKYGKAFQEKMKVWAKQFSDSGFGDYEKAMEAWGEKFGATYGKEMEEWGKQFAESFGEDFGDSMEAWEAQLEQSIERQMNAQEHAEASRMHAEAARHSAKQDRNIPDSNPYIKKTIIIRMPKKANLKVNVKYGELQFVSLIENLKAQLAHTKLTANTIDGSLTSIEVAYAPVSITHWNQGQLMLKYVEQAKIETVNQLVLNSNSSNIQLGQLSGNTIINGSFGNLKIAEITESFQNLNIVLENSDAIISLPKTAYSLQYNGKQSRFKHPKKTTSENVSTFSTGDVSSNKSIIVNAKFSKVLME
ncbi:hypothetical protein FNB79_08995 [Formosa sediminum]|uniref:DUF4097 domain-containing protein n=1 Tax=Formosa sediminum TaxID=2594004 RepID=A0A516GRH0_9FLAO|nr:hypothetical protein [Formosa sediminum]QDO94109.1 hypothetical protein FNB79_08995 [Formosa sediminum]